MRRLRASLSLIVLSIAAVAADAPPSVEPRGYVCHRAVGPIVVDGKLDEDSWKAVPWTAPFVDIEGEAKPRPRFATRAKMLWDDKAFYIAATLDEPHVRGTITEHDAVIFRDNDFEVFIDPDGDNHDYAELEINALNTTWDLRLRLPYRDGGKADNAWEFKGLKSAVAINGTINRPADNDRSWTVEIATPWASIAPIAHRACPPEEGDQWRLNFSRVEWNHRVVAGAYETMPGTKEDNWVWSPQGVVDMHRPERWGYVQFTRGEVGRVQVRADPTARARDRLIDIYEAQKAYKQTHGRWAATLTELGISSGRKPPTILRPTSDGGYEAMAVVAVGIGEVRPVSIGPSSRITLGPPQPAPGIDAR